MKKYVLISIIDLNKDIKVTESNDLARLIRKAKELNKYGYSSNIIDTLTENNVVIEE